MPDRKDDVDGRGSASCEREHVWRDSLTMGSWNGLRENLMLSKMQSGAKDAEHRRKWVHCGFAHASAGPDLGSDSSRGRVGVEAVDETAVVGPWPGFFLPLADSGQKQRNDSQADLSEETKKKKTNP